MTRAALTPSPKLAALALALGPLLWQAACAQTSPYYLGVTQTLGHESNIYRVGDQQVLPAGFSKSDTLSTTALIGGIDQTISRQRVYGNASLRANRYQSNSNLNNEGYGLNLAWDWATVDRLSGTLALAATQNLLQFNDTISSAGTVQTKRNLERGEQIDLKARLGVVTRLTLEAGLGLRQVSYSAVEYARNEYRQKSASLGLAYRSSDKLNLGVALRVTKADYPRFRALTDGSFENDTLNRNDIDFTADWRPSGSSQVSARLSPTRTRYDRNTGADFSGLTGSANWALQAGGRLRLTTTLSRDSGQSANAVNLGIFGQGTADYSRTTTALKLRADYDLTAKTALSASVGQANRSLVNTLNLGNGARADSGSDSTGSLSLGARWSPTRSVQVACDIGTEHRSSSNSLISVPLSSTSFSCSAQLVLQ